MLYKKGVIYEMGDNKPGDKIEDLTMDETDGFVDTTGIVTSIKSKDVVEFYVENPFVKIKDE